MTELLEKACAIGKLICVIGILGQDESPISTSRWTSNHHLAHKVTITSGARGLPDTLCQTLRPSATQVFKFLIALSDVCHFKKNGTSFIH